MITHCTKCGSNRTYQDGDLLICSMCDAVLDIMEDGAWLTESEPIHMSRQELLLSFQTRKQNMTSNRGKKNIGQTKVKEKHT